MLNIIKAIILGVVEGITEWLPISSTGHMILIDEFLQLDVSPEFKEMFFVVVQLGAIIAVVLIYWNKLWPFGYDKGIKIKKDTFSMWFKILVASIPAGVIGVLFDDKIDELFYNFQTVGLMLIIFGILFIVVENYNKGRSPKVTNISGITYKTAFIIGVFQLIAAVFPGTSRSGATIVGALIIGLSREVAAEFTFFLAVPAMAGASLLKLLKFGFNFTGEELAILGVGTVTAFAVSIFAINFLMNYIKTKDFKAFGWYRIVLGTIVLAYFGYSTLIK